MTAIEPPWVMGDTPRPTVRTIRPAGLDALSWADILAEPDAPMPKIGTTHIPRIGVTVLAGQPKVGKSLYGSQVGLGQRTTMIVEEGTRHGISYRLRRQAAELEVAEPDLDVIYRQHIRLDDRASVSRLRDHLAARRPQLVILDPLNRLHGGDENRPSQMTPVMDAMAAIAYDFDCAVLCLHHLNKPSMERRGDIWDRFRGATSIRSGTDANLILDGNGATVRMYGEFRDAEPVSEYLALDRESLIFRPADGPKAVGKVDPDELRAFVEESGQVTARDVMVRFGVKSKATAITALEGADFDSYDGPRSTRFYSLGTVQ